MKRRNVREPTGKLERLRKVVEAELGEDIEAIVMFEEDELGLGLVGGGGSILEAYVHRRHQHHRYSPTPAEGISGARKTA
jgi:hypothetical protein